MPTIVVLGQQFPADGQRSRLARGLIRALSSIPALGVEPPAVVVHFLEVSTYTSDPRRPRPVAVFVHLLRKEGRTKEVINELKDRIGAIVVGECVKETKISIRMRHGELDDWKLMTVT